MISPIWFRMTLSKGCLDITAPSELTADDCETCEKWFELVMWSLRKHVKESEAKEPHDASPGN